MKILPAFKKRPNGIILWEGPSKIDKKPIVFIATGIHKSSVNIKTGPMIQTWILRSDIHPYNAIHSGEDYSICGTCKHRGKIKDNENVGRSCYVNVGYAPSAVYRAYKLHKYTRSWNSETFRNKSIRLGSYGDPAAIPGKIIRRLLRRAKNWTGYTHRWASEYHLQKICMASVDSEQERILAKAKGWRTFRIKAEQSPNSYDEISCPASIEMNKQTQCYKCNLCKGLDINAKDITINIHGIGKNHYAKTNT